MYIRYHWTKVRSISGLEGSCGNTEKAHANWVGLNAKEERNCACRFCKKNPLCKKEHTKARSLIPNWDMGESDAGAEPDFCRAENFASPRTPSPCYDTPPVILPTPNHISFHLGHISSFNLWDEKKENELILKSTIMLKLVALRLYVLVIICGTKWYICWSEW